MRSCLLLLLAACSRAPVEEAAPWAQPPEPAWGDVPKTDEEARTLVTKEAAPSQAAKRWDPSTLRNLRADASKLVAGEDAIAATYDGWMNGDSKHASYLMFGTLHDSRAQIDAVVAIAVRMRSLWGLALEQFRAAGHWRSAPDVPSADDGDLALLTMGRRALGAVDEDAVFRVRQRQMRFDHAAWKFDYVPALMNLLYAARGAGLPVLGCDMPPELRASLTGGSPEERALRELHCARALRSSARFMTAAHGPDGALTEDDVVPLEHFVVVLGADHAEAGGLPRFLAKNARWLSVRVLGGRPHDAQGEENDLKDRLVVLDPVVVRGAWSDTLLLPDDTWGGSVERTTEHGGASPATLAGLPRSNVTVTSDEAARFSVGESSVDIGSSLADRTRLRSEWLQSRAGHQPFVLVAPSCTLIGAVDVPPDGHVELHFTPKERAVRIVVHSP